ncbi:MAG: hypothetical protein BZ135_03870 [Methanosphaera sp. rholeuAM6]|nr:MAG: hypothetical protein BZ135_03870 [Methanosphaera sp. rholeuAM6]
MKAIVFDNAGTILKRVTALKDMSTNNIIFETNTIGIVNENDESLILVFQTPTKKLIQHDTTIINYLKTHKESFEIAYSRKPFSKEDVIKALENDTTLMSEIKDSAYGLVKEYDIEICSGSALIIDIKKRKINYSYTAGGFFFEGTKELFQKINEMPITIYIASGDNKHSLDNIASILNVASENVYDTCNLNCKKRIVQKLQEDYDEVIMVGNQTNDYLAIKQANIGILSTQQGEQLPEKLLNCADYLVDDIKKVLKIVEDEVKPY